MVFQTEKKQTTTTRTATDFNDLELVKQTEKKSVQNIENAKKRADKIIADTNKNLMDHKEKSIADLTYKLDQLYKLEERKAISQAEKIKIDGEAEAEQLKQEVKGRISKAVDHVVNSIISE